MTREEALEKIHDPRGPLDEQERRALADWLERDVELRAIHEEQTALFAAMDSWEDDVEPSADFDRKLWARIEADEARPSWAQSLVSWLSWPRAAWAGCAVAAALAVVAWVGPQSQPAEPEPVAKVALSGDDAEYLEELDRALDDMEMLIDFDALAPAPVTEDRS